MENKRSDSRNGLPLLALAVIIVVAILLRFVNLYKVPGWWPDEGVMLNIATNLSHWRMQMFSFIYPMNPHPPLFFLLGTVFIKFFGSSILTLRTLSAVLGTLTVIITFFTGRKLKDNTTGLLAAALVAVTPAIILTSRLALSYELLSFLYSLTLLLALIWSNKKDDRILILASLCAGFCVVTSYIGLVAIAFLLIFVAALAWRKIALALAYSLIPVALYVVIILFIDRDAFVHDILYMFSRPENAIGTGEIVQSFRKLIRGFPFLALGAVGYFFTKQKLGLFALFFVILIASAEFKTRGLWWYMMTFMPILCLGLGSLLSELLSKRDLPRVTGIFLATFVFIFGFWQSTRNVFVNKNFALEEEKNFSPSDFPKLEEAVNYINQNTTTNDMVLSSAHLSWMLHAKASDPILSYVSHNKSTTNFPDDMEKTGRFVYNPDYTKAKYLLEDKFMRGWFPGQPGIKEGVMDPIKRDWKLVFDSNEFKIYLNPKLN